VRSLWSAIVVIVALAAPARAHQSSVKIVDITVDNKRATIAFTIAPGDVTEPLGLAADAQPTPDQAARPAAAAYVAGWIGIRGCTPSPPRARVDGGFVVVEWQVTCAQAIDQLELDFSRFFELDARHEAVVSVHEPGDRNDPEIVRASEPVIIVRAGDAGIGAWILYGMDHIYGGLDHVCFILALLIVVVLVRRDDEFAVRAPWSALRGTAAIVTAFTVAHTLTLIGAALGWISLPSRLVESVIAASIVYTAIENVIRPDARWRFALTFAFGLIHGLGFASQLEARLPPTNVVLPLLGFNLGVELGQLTVVAVALPVFWLVARWLGPGRYRRYVVPSVAVTLSVIGIKWLIERVFEV
jgi:hypothetical protein